MTSELRRNDYTLTEEQQQLSQMVRELFDRHSPKEAVRRAEPLGFDAVLWGVLARNGVLGIGLDPDCGGEGGGLVEIALVAMEAGRSLASAPLVDHLVTARLVGALDANDLGGDVPDASSALDGSTILSLAPLSTWESGAELIPGGAVANAVLAWRDDALIVMTRRERARQAANQASSPLAWWDPGDAAVEVVEIGRGPAVRRLWTTAQQEWKVATAAALVGLAGGASEVARGYALERNAFGVPIAKFQAISHTLVDLHMDHATARNVCLKAAWLTEHDPGYRPELPAMALAHASRVALRGVSKAVHVHGGFGITLEADITLYYRRASAWALVSGGASSHFAEIAESIDRIRAERDQMPLATRAH